MLTTFVILSEFFSIPKLVNCMSLYTRDCLLIDWDIDWSIYLSIYLFIYWLNVLILQSVRLTAQIRMHTRLRTKILWSLRWTCWVGWRRDWDITSSRWQLTVTCWLCCTRVLRFVSNSGIFGQSFSWALCIMCHLFVVVICCLWCIHCG